MESKRDLVIDQVPITTKPPWPKYYTTSKLLAVTKIKEKSPYKPEATLLCMSSRSKKCNCPHFAPKEVTGFAMNYSLNLK